MHFACTPDHGRYGLGRSTLLDGIRVKSSYCSDRIHLSLQGFLTSLVEEIITGKGTLQQIGIVTPNPAALWTIIGLSGGATLFATVQTLVKAQTKTMPPK